MEIAVQQQRIRSGYKQTEVGVIPGDWGVVSAFEACSKIQDGTHFSPRSGGRDYLYVTSKNVRFGHLDLSTAGWIDAAQHQAIYQRCDVKKGDLLLTKDGANTGNAALNTLTEEFSLLSSVAFLRFNPIKHCAAYFLQQVLTSQGQHQIQDAMAGNAITRLTLEKINKLRFPVPPTKAEEEAIAEALGDVDALIGALDGLIAKKRDLKQAAMQHLLTGTQRLPGFSGKWEVKRLGEVCSIKTGKKDVNEGNPSGVYPFFTCSRESTFSDGYSFDGEAILIAGNGEVGNLHRYKGRFEAYQRTYVLQDFALDISYLWHQLDFFFKKSLGIDTIGSSIPYIKRENIADFTFSAPVDEVERSAISTILSDMDAEITALEQRRDKTRALKQGMMQELLTGKTRFV